MDGAAAIANKSWPAISLRYPQRHFGAALCTEIQSRTLYQDFNELFSCGKIINSKQEQYCSCLLFFMLYKYKPRKY
jgi:hypothetical protein